MNNFSLRQVRLETKFGSAISAATTIFIIAAAQLYSSDQAFAETAGPTDNKGTTSKILGNINLKEEIPGMDGRQLRARYTTIEPGGHIASHNHSGRRTLEYVQQGNVIEIRNGVETPDAQGEMVVATHDVTHWWENRGTVPAVLVPIDIYKP